MKPYFWVWAGILCGILALNIGCSHRAGLTENRNEGPMATKGRKVAEVDSSLMKQCQIKTDKEVAEMFLHFLLLAGWQAADPHPCGEELKSIPLKGRVFIEGDVKPKMVILNEQDAVTISRLERLKDEFGFDMNTIRVWLEIKKAGRVTRSVFDFSRSLFAQDADVFGCGYMRAPPTTVVAFSRCLSP